VVRRSRRRLEESFWIVPALFSAAALLLALFTTTLDEWLELDGLGSEPFGFSGGADAARAFLITVAGSIIAVAATSFSITIAVLALTSVQFGPRLIRNFRRDLGNQTVLGVFLGTFLFSMVVLRTIRSDGESEFVPYVSIAVASFLALLSLAFLIYFLAHVSRSIQVMNVIASIGRGLDEAISEMFPEEQPGQRDSRSDGAEAEQLLRKERRPIAARRSGYIQAIDFRLLVDIASVWSLRIFVPHHTGQFVARGTAIAEAVHDDGTLPESPDLAESIVAAFQVGGDRLSDQDVEYHIDQLVEIAVRALSPAINDPFTAIACVDRLGASLRYLAGRQLPSPYHRDESGTLRVAAKTLTFQGALDAAFNLIRQYGRSSAPVSMRLIETLAVIAEHTTDPAETEALLSHAKMVEHGARQEMAEEPDIDALEERFRLAIAAIRAPDEKSL
jgi:uncharacterized membrane protein